MASFDVPITVIVTLSEIDPGHALSFPTPPPNTSVGLSSTSHHLSDGQSPTGDPPQRYAITALAVGGVAPLTERTRGANRGLTLSRAFRHALAAAAIAAHEEG